MADTNNCGCGQSEEKVLTESGLRRIISKLTGRILLAVGVIRAEGDSPLSLWKENTEDGVTVRGSVDLSGYQRELAYYREDEERHEASIAVGDNELNVNGNEVSVDAPKFTYQGYEVLNKESLKAGDNVTLTEDADGRTVISATAGGGDTDLSGYATIENVYKKLETLGVLTAPTIAVTAADCDGTFTDTDGARTLRVVFDCDLNLNDYSTKRASNNYQDVSNPGLMVYNSGGTSIFERSAKVVEGDATAQRDAKVYSMSAEIASDTVADEIEHGNGVWISLLAYYNLFNPQTQYASHVESGNYIHVYMSAGVLYAGVTDDIG